MNKKDDSNKKDGYIQCKINANEKIKFIEAAKREGYDEFSDVLRILIRNYIKKSEQGGK